MIPKIYAIVGGNPAKVIRMRKLFVHRILEIYE